MLLFNYQCSLFIVTNSSPATFIVYHIFRCLSTTFLLFSKFYLLLLVVHKLINFIMFSTVCQQLFYFILLFSNHLCLKQLVYNITAIFRCQQLFYYFIYTTGLCSSNTCKALYIAHFQIFMSLEYSTGKHILEYIITSMKHLIAALETKCRMVIKSDCTY